MLMPTPELCCHRVENSLVDKKNRVFGGITKTHMNLRYGLNALSQPSLESPRVLSRTTVETLTIVFYYINFFIAYSWTQTKTGTLV